MSYVFGQASANGPRRRTHAGTGAVMVFSFAFRLPFSKPKNAARLIPADHVVSTMHGTRTVLLDVRNGNYWGLDDVGSRIWELTNQGLAPREIAERLADEYEAPVDDLFADVIAFLEQLAKSKLVRRVA